VLDDTHRPDLRSWVESANDRASDFPIQNLPLGIIRRSVRETPVAAAAIGDKVLDLGAASRAGWLSNAARDAVAACADGTLNGLMALGPDSRRALRVALVDALRIDSDAGRRARASAKAILVDATDVELLLPARIGDYTDFYASIHHATNVGSMFRPDNPLLPNYKYVPIGYHGRASSIVMSGSDVVRPSGQTKGDNDPAPTFGPTKRLDYELEVGVFIG
jgi:fumarylacetoacetase